MRQRDYRPGRMLQAARSPALAVVTGAVLVHRFSHPLLVRALDRWVSSDKSRLIGSQPDSPAAG